MYKFLRFKGLFNKKLALQDFKRLILNRPIIATKVHTPSKTANGTDWINILPYSASPPPAMFSKK